jgi:hypothetical protein
MARDLADELAEREAELGQMADQASSSGSNGEQGKDGDTPGKGENGERGSSARRGTGRGGWGGDLTDAERLERIEEAARTLEEWLKGATQRAEGKAAEQVRDVTEQSKVTQVVERTQRVGELYLGGQKPEASREAKELAKTLEVLARQLDVLHRGIVAPELAALVEYDRRVGELTARLTTLKTDAEITEWHREAAALVRDLEKAGLASAATALADAMAAGGWHGGHGAWHWGVNDHDFLVAPVGYTKALGVVATRIQDQIQDLILKDLKSARDEATPPEFKELVERYYEVLSKDSTR